MPTIIFLLSTTLLIFGCATEGRFSKSVSSECSGGGGTFVNLHYSNNEIRTNGKALLLAGHAFEIRLKPKNDSNNRLGVDYQDSKVTISGKNTASGWLKAEGSFNSTSPPHHQLVICVDKDQAKGTYYYQIEIEEAGRLDPRADVY